jgi:hypothetical protein
MQAGETLSSAVESSRKGFERTTTDYEMISKFADISTILLKKAEQNIESREIFDGERFINVFESSYKTSYVDGSYIHIVVYGHNVEDLIDLGLHISEHSDDGNMLFGFNYQLISNELIRRTVEIDVENDGTLDHFSIFEIHSLLEELSQIEAFGDDSKKEEVRAIKEGSAEDKLLSMYDMEFDGVDGTLRLSELENLEEIILYASPFKVIVEEEDL